MPSEDRKQGLRKRGHRPFLKDLEPSLVEWIELRERERRPVYRAELAEECQRYIDWNEIPLPKGTKNRWRPWKPTQDWWDSFFDQD